MIDKEKVQALINEGVQRQLGAAIIDRVSGEAHMRVMQERIEELEAELTALKASPA